MDPAEKRTKFAEAISEGVNCLAIFLCRPTLAKLRAEVPGVLRHWESECAPWFRQIGEAESRIDGRALRAGLARISRVAAAGVDPEVPDQLAELRAAIREVFGALRFPLPQVSPDEATVCELHGAGCPALGNSGR